MTMTLDTGSTAGEEGTSGGRLGTRWTRRRFAAALGAAAPVVVAACAGGGAAGPNVPATQVSKPVTITAWLPTDPTNRYTEFFRAQVPLFQQANEKIKVNHGRRAVPGVR